MNCAPYIILQPGGHYESGYGLNNNIVLSSPSIITPQMHCFLLSYRHEDLICSIIQCWDSLFVVIECLLYIHGINFFLNHWSLDHFVYVPTQWEMALHCNDRRPPLAGRIHRMVHEKVIVLYKNEYSYTTALLHTIVIILGHELRKTRLSAF